VEFEGSVGGQGDWRLVFFLLSFVCLFLVWGGKADGGGGGDIVRVRRWWWGVNGWEVPGG